MAYRVCSFVSAPICHGNGAGGSPDRVLQKKTDACNERWGEDIGFEGVLSWKGQKPGES